MQLLTEFTRRVNDDGIDAAVEWAFRLPPKDQAALKPDLDLFIQVYTFVAQKLGPHANMDAAVLGAQQAVADVRRQVRGMQPLLIKKPRQPM